MHSHCLRETGTRHMNRHNMSCTELIRELAWQNMASQVTKCESVFVVLAWQKMAYVSWPWNLWYVGTHIVFVKLTQTEKDGCVG